MTLSSELLFLTLTASLTGLLWVPIILNRFAENGIWTAIRNPKPDERARADWAYRLSHAHSNAVENLVVFAPLALMIDSLGLATPLTALAAALFFISRLAHALIYTLGIPVLRTLAFLIGFGCQIVFALRLLGLL